VQRDQHGRARAARIELGANALVIGLKELLEALAGVDGRKPFIARDSGALAPRRDRIGCPRRTVRVDHQSRVVVHDQERIEAGGEPPSELGDAEIPGHVRGKLAFG
jgi:hypothetical protein